MGESTYQLNLHQLVGMTVLKFAWHCTICMALHVLFAWEGACWLDLPEHRILSKPRMFIQHHALARG